MVVIAGGDGTASSAPRGGGRLPEVGVRRGSGYNPIFAPAVLAWLQEVARGEGVSQNAVIARTLDAAARVSGVVACAGGGQAWERAYTRVRCPACRATAQVLGVPDVMRNPYVHRVPMHVSHITAA